MKKYTYMWEYNDMCNLADRYIKFMKIQGITDIYLQLTLKSGFDISRYRPLIKKLTMNGISAHAMNGASHWVRETGFIYDFLSLVEAYNQGSAPEESFIGVHFDIEPYTLPEWNVYQASLISQWNAIIQEYTEVSSLINLPVSAAVPFWFYRLGDDLTQTILNNHDHITVMSYRNTISGANSVVSLLDPLLYTSMAIGGTADIVAGLETVKVNEGPHISFYGSGSDQLRTSIRQLRNMYQNNPVISGIAVHSLTGWMDLT